MSVESAGLSGRVAIVTGAGRGLGRAMALALAGAGAQVIGTAARQRAEIEQVAAECRAGGLPGVVVAELADVSDAAACDRLVASAAERFGSVDILINNAGRGMKYVSERFMTEPTRFWETEADVWRMVIETNVSGPFYMARAAVPRMLEAGWGRIVNVSVNQQTMRRPGFSPYGPSKAALESETIIWSQELAGTGVTVNALLPGGASDTGMVPDTLPSALRAKLIRPDVMAPPLLWLCSRAADAVTGRRIVANRWLAGDPGAAMDDAGWAV